MAGSSAALVAALVLAPTNAVSQAGRLCVETSNPNEALSGCFGSGQTIELPAGVSVRLRKEPGGTVDLKDGPLTLEIVQDTPSLLSAVLHRGSAIATFVAGRVGITAGRKPRVVQVAVNSTVEIAVGEGAVRVRRIEGDIRMSRAVVLQGSGQTVRGNARREQSEPRYFDDMFSLSDEYTYSLTEDYTLDVESCFDYFNEQLQREMAFGDDDIFIAEGYRNVGDCHLDDGNWGAAIESFESALGIDRQLFGDIDPDVAEDYRALGDAYLEWGLWRLYENDESPANEFDAAVQYFENARRIDEQLLQFDPEDLYAAADLAIDYRALGDTYWDLADNLDVAIEFYDAALDIDRRNYQTDPYDPYFREDLVLDLCLLSDALYARAQVGDEARALEFENEAEALGSSCAAPY